MLKAVTIFLIVVAVFAMFGKLGWLGRQIGLGKRPGRLSRPATCRHCGSFIIGKGPCDCRGPRGKGPDPS